MKRVGFLRPIMGLFVVALLFLFPCLSAFASYGMYLQGFGAKDSGMAGSSLALPEDAFTAVYNPAGMTGVSTQMNVGLVALDYPRGYRANGAGNVSQGDYESRDSFFLLPNIGYVRQLHHHDSVGVLLYTNAPFDTDYSSGANVYGSGSAGIVSSQAFLNTYYARQLTSYLSAGLGIVVAGQTFNARGIASFSPYTKDNSIRNLTDEGTDYSVGVAPQISLQINLPQKISFAAAYRPKIYMSKFGLYKNLLAGGGELDSPPIATFGIALRMIQNMAFTGEIQRIWFGDVPSLTNGVARLADIGTHPDYRLGASKGAGFGWDNTTIYSLGYEWHSNASWTWRLGYSYANQPINKEDALLNILAPYVSQDHLSAGATKKINQHNELSAYVIYVPSHSLRGYNTLVPTQEITLYSQQFQCGIGWAWLI